LRRRLATLLSAVSLALCVATVALWARGQRSADGPGERYSWVAGGPAPRRFTLRSEPDRLRITAPHAWRADARPGHGPRSADDVRRFLLGGPPAQPRWDAARPPPPAGPGPQTLADLLAGLRNDQVRWVEGQRLFRVPGRPSVMYAPVTGGGTPAHLLGTQRYPIRQSMGPGLPGSFGFLGLDPPVVGDADLIPGLLAALEDPDRFAAAHVLLGDRTAGRVPGRPLEWVRHADGLARVVYDGLAVDLRPPPEDPERFRPVGGHGYADEYRPAFAAGVDGSRQAAIRDEWHRRLDADVVSVRHRDLAAAAGILPAAWLAGSVVGAVRRRRRRAANRCPACGYDLRATPGRCPECGAVPKSIQASN
jgi:hypothetical protein